MSGTAIEFADWEAISSGGAGGMAITITNTTARFVAGADADAVQTVERKARVLLAQVRAHREISSNLAHDDALNALLEQGAT